MKRHSYIATVTNVQSGVRASVIVTLRHYDHSNDVYRLAAYEVGDYDQPRVGEEVTVTIESRT